LFIGISESPNYNGHGESEVAYKKILLGNFTWPTSSLF